MAEKFKKKVSTTYIISSSLLEGIKNSGKDLSRLYMRMWNCTLLSTRIENGVFYAHNNATIEKRPHQRKMWQHFLMMYGNWKTRKFYSTLHGQLD